MHAKPSAYFLHQLTSSMSNTDPLAEFSYGQSPAGRIGVLLMSLSSPVLAWVTQFMATHAELLAFQE